MKKLSKQITALATAIFFTLTEAGLSPAGFAALAVRPPSEVKFSAPFQLALPSELGTVEDAHSGAGATIVHLQTAHGNYEAQKKIESILHYLKSRYGFNLLLLEGTSFKLRPELLQFFPGDKDMTQKVAERLAKKALLKGHELFLLKDPETPAYGIENLEAYVSNGESFKAVLTEQEETRGFLQDMDQQIERLTAPYLNKDLKSFLRRLEDYEAKRVSFLDWLIFLGGEAKKFLEIDLTNPMHQMDWPMLLRIFTLQELESKTDMAAFAEEKEKFLKAINRIPSQVREEIERLLSSPLAQRELPGPETGILFEKMVSSLPEDFDFEAFPNVRRFIAHTILQSELRAERLQEELNRLVELVSQKLAKTEKEKKLLLLLRDHRLLKRLFALELTPEDHEEILKRGEEIRPGDVIRHFIELNEDGRVKNIEFSPGFKGRSEPIHQKTCRIFPRPLRQCSGKFCLRSRSFAGGHDHKPSWANGAHGSSRRFCHLGPKHCGRRRT